MNFCKAYDACMFSCEHENEPVDCEDKCKDICPPPKGGKKKTAKKAASKKTVYKKKGGNDNVQLTEVANPMEGGKKTVRKSSLEACTVAELREKCAKKGIKHSGLKKAELVAALRRK